MSKEQFVLGFAFSKDLSHVVLILKNRPKQLAGKLSVPGGHVEPEDETPRHAAAREFQEETGLDIPENAWQHADTFVGWNDSLVHVYKAYDDIVFSARSETDEEVIVFAVDKALSDARMDLRACDYIRDFSMELSA